MAADISEANISKPGQKKNIKLFVWGDSTRGKEGNMFYCNSGELTFFKWNLVLPRLCPLIITNSAISAG